MNLESIKEPSELLNKDVFSEIVRYLPPTNVVILKAGDEFIL